VIVAHTHPPRWPRRPWRAAGLLPHGTAARAAPRSSSYSSTCRPASSPAVVSSLVAAGVTTGAAELSQTLAPLVAKLPPTVALPGRLTTGVRTIAFTEFQQTLTSTRLPRSSVGSPAKVSSRPTPARRCWTTSGRRHGADADGALRGARAVRQWRRSAREGPGRVPVDRRRSVPLL